MLNPNYGNLHQLKLKLLLLKSCISHVLEFFQPHEVVLCNVTQEQQQPISCIANRSNFRRGW